MDGYTRKELAWLALGDFVTWCIRGFAIGIGFAGAILAVKWVSGG